MQYSTTIALPDMLSINIGSLEGELTVNVLDRWECVFKKLNCLLKK